MGEWDVEQMLSVRWRGQGTYICSTRKSSRGDVMQLNAAEMVQNGVNTYIRILCGGCRFEDYQLSSIF